VSVVARLHKAVRLVRGDDEMRYRLAELVARVIHPQAILSERGRLWVQDQAFRARFERIGGTWYRNLDRVYFLGQLAALSCRAPGDTVECGAYLGLSSVEICRATQPGRRHHVFDSFAGLSEPDDVDGPYWRKGSMSSSEAVFRDNLAEHDVVTYAGWIPERFSDLETDTLCFVHVDVDLYQPTLDSLQVLYGLVSPGGVIVCDDYGFDTCPGASRAVDEFAATIPETVLSAPTGQGVIFKGLPPLTP
jgi:predicted O-methyltransferase YrrM